MVTIDDDEMDEDEEQSGRFIWRSASRDANFVSESRWMCLFPTYDVYRGHCNVKTVKDVNFFGLQDDMWLAAADFGPHLHLG